MPREHLIHALYRIGAIQFGEFTLKSGKTSPIYIDLRLIISYPDILREVAKLMWEAVTMCRAELLCGVPYTALSFATCMSLDQHLPMVMRRKEKKDYGLKKQIEGVYHKGQTCLVIEDVITTGGSVIETAKDLEAAGLKVFDVVILIDREQGGRQNLLAQNYIVHSVLTLTDILHVLARSAEVRTQDHPYIQRVLAELAS